MVGRKDTRGGYLRGLDEAMKMLVEARRTIHCVNCKNSLGTLYHRWKQNVLYRCLSLANTLQLP